MLCFILTTERIKPEIKENQQSLSLIDTFKSLTTNKAMISMVVVSIVLIFSTLMGQTVNTYLCIDYFNNVNALSTLSIISLPIYLVVGALAAKLADKFGKKEVSMIGLMIAGGIFLVAYFMHIKNAYTFIAIYAEQH